MVGCGGSYEAELIKTIHAALDPASTSSTRAGLWLWPLRRDRRLALAQGGRRKQAVIATKVGLAWQNGKPYRNASKSRIAREVEDSLRRLQTDVIDIYQVHWPDPDIAIEETAEAMAELYRAGKIRAIGVSNFNPAQMDAFRAVAPLHTVQPPYNLFERGIEHSVLPFSRDRGVTSLVYGRSAVDCFRRMNADTASPETICAVTIQNFNCPGFASTSLRSNNSIASPW